VLIPPDEDVESDVTLLVFALMPDDADVESAVALLFVVDSPVESEPTPL